MQINRHIATTLTALVALIFLTSCKDKSESSDSDEANATVATSTDTTATVITGSLSFSQPALPAEATDIATGSKARLLLLANGACQSSPPQASGTWSSHATWKYLEASTFSAFKSANSELFSPLSSVLSGASQVCVVSDTEYTYQSGTSQAVSSIPVGTFAAIFAVDDSSGLARAVGLSSVTISSDVTATLTLSMQDIDIDITNISSAMGSTLPADANFVFLSGTPMARVGICSALSVGARDSSGNLLTPSFDVSLTLSTTSSSGQFYSDASCISTTSSATLLANTQSVVLYYRDSVLQSPTLTVAEASGLSTPASQAAHIVSVDTPQLIFPNGTLNQAVGTCGALNLVLQSESGTTPSYTQSILVALTTSSLTGSFYSDANCLYSVSSNVTVSSPYYSTVVYYKDSADSSPILAASASSGAAIPASLAATIGQGASSATSSTATKLAFVGSAQMSTSNSGCYILTVQQVDSNGTPARLSSSTLLSLATTSAYGTFYAGTDCSQTITSSSIAAGNSAVYVSYSDRSTGTPTVTVHASGLQSASITLNVIAQSEPQLDFGGVFGYSGSYSGAPITNPNWITGSSTCPAGFTATKALGATNIYGSYVDYPLYFCWRMHKSGFVSPVDFGGFYSVKASGAALAVNPLTGGTTCPASFTSKLVIGTLNVDDMVFVCQRTHTTASGSWYFGGMYGQGSSNGIAQNYANPLTGALSCPSGFNSIPLLGNTGLDYTLNYCYR